MVSQLESLKKFSSVVADTGDIDSIQKFNSTILLSSIGSGSKYGTDP